VQEIAESTQTGAATNILSGIATGMESSVVAVIVICVAILVSKLIMGGGEGSDAEKALATLYGISLCGMGMLTTTGVIVSMDTFGPVADNAQGIAQMAGVEEAMPVLEQLDAVGNVTKAATKGFAIASAVLAALSLFGTYLSNVAAADQGLATGEFIDPSALVDYVISVATPEVFIGILIGAALPFLFSSMTIRAVGRAAFQIINEVRRQFKEIPGLMEGTGKPDSARCVDICTQSAIRELVAPGLLAILAPVIVGGFLGWQGLGGYLAGIIVGGQLLAVFMSNAGGAWDNAKKYVEDGNLGGKGSDAHKAAVVGDTVGDPFKDTAGPALNPLIKVMNLVGLMITPLVVKHEGLTMILIGIICLVAVLIAFVMARSGSGYGDAEVHDAVGSGSE